MRSKLLQAGCLLAIVLGSTACTAARIVGKTTLMDERGVALAPTQGVTVNFINLEGKLEDSIASAQTDVKGKYASAVLPPGKYTVEAMFPGYVIERTTVVLKKHGKKKAPFVLKKIQETSGRSVNEALEENIPNPGEVKIKPPRE
jgi:hypothetical protein